MGTQNGWNSMHSFHEFCFVGLQLLNTKKLRATIEKYLHDVMDLILNSSKKTRDVQKDSNQVIIRLIETY